MTLRYESWSQDLDRLIDFAIGRPYHWNMVALRAVVAVLAIVIAVYLLITPLFPDDCDIIRTLLASLVGIYALVEFIVGYLYFNLNKRRVTGLHFWARGYCVHTVGLDEEVVRKYIREQEAIYRRQMELESE